MGKARETYIDELLRAEKDQGTGENLGPGSHDPLPVERVFQAPKEEIHGRQAKGLRDSGGGGVIGSTPRPASFKSFRDYPANRLPSSFHNPGPGSYTQHTSFGAASGPTRTTFLPKATGFHTAR